MLKSISKSRRLVSTLSAVFALTFSAPLFAAEFLLDDLEHGGNKNKLGEYWYFYADGYSSATGIMTNFSDPFSPITSGYQNSNYAAGMVFTDLSVGKTKEYPSIGMGTKISESDTKGIGSNFAGVDTVSFWAKGPGSLKFSFSIETEDNSGNADVYAIVKEIAAGSANQWILYKIAIKPVLSAKAGDLAQEGWGGAAAAFTFNPAKATKLAWSIKAASNTNITAAGTFVVDDIKFIGTFVAPDPPDMCRECLTSAFGASAPNVLLSDFDGTPANGNALGYYWYPYANPEQSTAPTAVTTTEAGRGGGNSVSAAFTMGSASVRYAGIGTNLYDEAKKNYLNAANFTNAGGVYFEYKTTGTGVDYLKFQVMDKYSAENASANSDFYILLPGSTSGEWKSAAVNFSKLKLPSGAVGRTLNTAELAKLQFAYNGGGDVAIFIDNVYFYGDNKFNVPYNVTVTYTAGEGGALKVGSSANLVTTHPETITLPDGVGQTITAVANIGYKFKGWSDGAVQEAARIDNISTISGKENFSVTAQFERDVETIVTPITVKYSAGNGGTLTVGSGDNAESKSEFEFKLKVGEAAKTVKAEPIEGYTFVRWSDGKAEAERTDIAEVDTLFTAVFVKDMEIIAGETYHLLTYQAGVGGTLCKVPNNAVDLPTYESTYGFNVKEGETGPLIKAVPNDGYTFVKWSDDKTEDLRSDVALVEKTYIAEFEPNADIEYNLVYKAQEGGYLKIDNATNLVPEYSATTTRDEDGPYITAVASGGYRFVEWDDGYTQSQRRDINSNVNVIAIFEPTGAVASFDRFIITDKPKAEAAVFAPITVFAGELAAGPNPVQKRSKVNFFWNGRALQSGTALFVYNTTGNLVNKISVLDITNGADRRKIAVWNLQDAKGRSVSEGTYLIKGALQVKNGNREKVSVLISVVK